VTRAPHVCVERADALACYASWPAPTVIVSDGAYGVGGFPGDPPTEEGLRAWYAPHVAAWSRHAAPATTLWFWGTELGWATVHPLLAMHAWRYRALHVWDKGLAHVAGNANTRTLRKLPTVTEVCVQYVRDVCLDVPGGRALPLREWLCHEWTRAGLSRRAANAACGVKDAASRKYFAPDHRWYPPPPEHFARLAAHANAHGDPAGRPYFARAGVPLDAAAWAALRAKFRCPVGVTNVWSVPAVRGAERVKVGGRAVHANQKPLALLDRTIRLASDPGDVIWDPFGGLFSVALAAHAAGRDYYGAEHDADFYACGVQRLRDHGVALRERR